MTRPTTERVPVLIAGAGPVGLSLALALGRAGVRSINVERHPSLAIHPKARGVNPRTMELFRTWGILEEVRSVADPPEADAFIEVAASAADPGYRRMASKGTPVGDRSPVDAIICPQDLLEPVLLDAVGRTGAGDVRFLTELVSLEQDDRGVTATVRHRGTGATSTIAADHLVGCDGGRSVVRAALGIELEGIENLGRHVNVLVQANLERYLAERPARFTIIRNPDFQGGLIRAGTDRWLVIRSYDADDPRVPEAPDDAYGREVVPLALGDDDIDFEVLSVLAWTAAAQVATRYRDRRVFLAGDAAHLFVPAGGFGMNTGIADAHGLAWRLAWVARGWAGTGLLDSYEDERRPVAQANADESVVRAMLQDARNHNGEGDDSHGLELGFSYRSAAVVPDGTPPPERADPVRDYRPDARPGSRVPHLWLDGVGPPSTLDLCDDSLAILTSPGGRAWVDAAAAVGQTLEVPVSATVIGADDPGLAARWQDLSGVGPDGAIVVRPDGHVAARFPALVDDPAMALLGTLRQVLARPATTPAPDPRG